MNLATVVLAVVTVLLAYFLASGFAFIATYRMPSQERAKLYSRIFKPLEVIAGRFPSFQRLYTGFHHWCYRTFVKSDQGPP